MKPQLLLRPSLDRGFTNLGWLKSRHTFSFGQYHDPAWRGFGRLLVINDDVVAPLEGFDTHGHKDMEIISIVLSGELAHRDSLGSHSVLTAGAIQVMSAGSGIRHSEYNPSSTNPVHFIQVWIEPSQKGTTPWYREFHNVTASSAAAEQSLIGGDAQAHIGQDAHVSIITLTAGTNSVKKQVAAGRGHWIHVIDGAVTVEAASLTAGDGVGVTAGAYTLAGSGRVLFFDVPYAVARQ